MEKKNLVFIDAETDGLYGTFLTVGIKVVSPEGQNIDQAYYGIKRENMQISEPWVQENVVPKLGAYESCENEEELLEKTWNFWMKYQSNSYAVADVPYPVEGRLFEKCVMKNPEERKWKAPYPLLDTASILWARGIEPLTARELLIEKKEDNQHNALADAQTSAEIVGVFKAKEMNKKKKFKTISEHIFACPFKICDMQKLDVVKENLQKRNWKRKTFSALDPDDFMLRQYLNVSVRDVYMSEKEDAVCEIYQLQVDEKTRYVIGEEYQLPVYALEFHLYRVGIGILFIHVKNEEHRTISAIRKINDLGRRIGVPFLPKKPENERETESKKTKPFILCADKLGIQNVSGAGDSNSQSDSCITDFLEAVKQWQENPENLEEKYKKCLTHPAEFVYDLLGCTMEQLSTTADDRMFLMCVLRDEELSKKIENDYESEEDSLYDELYKILYVDGDNISCVNRKMRNRLLEDSIYERWSGCGTLHGVTNYSMFCITTPNPVVDASVVKPFLLEYKYLLSLALAQKIGITMFSELAGKIVIGVDDPKLIKRKQVESLIGLQEHYITFKNQLFSLEASCQEQGIEIYQLLQKQLRISEEQSILDEQLECLYEVTTVSNGRRIENWGLWLALAAIGIDTLWNLLDHGCLAKVFVWIKAVFSVFCK